MRVEIKIVGYADGGDGRKRPTRGIAYVSPEEVALITEGPYVSFPWDGPEDTSYITLKSGHSIQAIGSTTHVNDLLLGGEDEERKRILEDMTEQIDEK